MRSVSIGLKPVVLKVKSAVVKHDDGEEFERSPLC